MADWKRTSCALCYHNCGLELQTEGHRITKVRADKNHPRTKGYICRKGARIAYYQDHRERITHPLKRVGERFVRITWEQALSEIADKLLRILSSHGPRSLAYMGGGGQGSHMETAFGRNLLTALGSQYHYSSLAQELTGLFWVNGRAYGRQNLHLGPDLDRAENFLVIGWNGYVSNAGVNLARRRIDEFAGASDKRLIVVDPLLSETARKADIHLKPRIGTIALFLKSMIALILQEGWEDRGFIQAHCKDFERVASWFRNFDLNAALGVCGLNPDEVREVAGLYATRPTAIRSDLGLLMDRQSTMNSYLEMILMAICGRVGTAGGNVFYGHFMPMGPHTDERDPDTWRTVRTKIPAIMGYYPPNVVQEEILSEKKDRLRAMIVSGSNPVRSYADTLRYEGAFRTLDLLVTIEVAMTETCRMSHYVLPAKSAFEKWDGTFFAITFPEVFFQLRHPACESRGEALEEGEIYTRLARRLGLLPDIPETLHQAAREGRTSFALALMNYLAQEKMASGLLPFILAETLGRELGSAHLAALWGILIRYPQFAGDELQRAGYSRTPTLGDMLFQDLLDHPEGILIGRVDPEKNLDKLRTGDRRIHLYIEEMENWMEEIDPEKEKAALNRSDFPFVLVAGRHYPYNANSIMRNPAWNDSKPVCTLLISGKDAGVLCIKQGEEVRVTTETSDAVLPAEISDITVPGTVVIPHGFGMIFDGRLYGVNVNRLTGNKHRDRIAATPLHRYVPCRVEKVA